MHLYLNKTSPYARLALVAAHETGLAGALQLVWTDPWTDAPELLAVNPLGKVPALATDDGACLIESDAIVQYLLALSGDVQLLPAAPAQRLATLGRLGLARAVIDCAFGAVIRTRFGDAPDSILTRRWLAALPRAVAAIERDLARQAAPDRPVDLGDLALGVAFAYCDLRQPQLAWRADAPRLAALVERVCQRPSMVATAA
ncbi:glutathione S-transferase [Duganella sp. FT92W]|uniref:Glutathione S-transferase n=1 Tax=Pseudoduganella rivuli TaxID=2666085 RepID=A0A7X2IJD2_9BURK|nr:glutathione S-transferase family protein [Pseudoduganella rivuli]MRV70642.1 glutathione S-transferase [Pseudoduganella rivuli]